MGDFANRKKGGCEGKQKQYSDKRKQIQEQVKKLKETGNNNTPHGGWVGGRGVPIDFRDGDLADFEMALDKRKRKYKKN